MSDPSQLLVTNLLGINSGLIGLSAASHYRMMFINPRRYFDPSEKFDFSKVLRQVAVSSFYEWAQNTLDTAVAGAGVITSIVSRLIPSILKDADGSFFMFYINPHSMKVSHQKIANETLTGGGWDFDVLGDNLSTFTFSGTSGNLMSVLPINIPGIGNPFTLYFSRAYLKFLAFEQFYLYNNNDPLLMILDQTAYVVKLVSMNWSWEANDIFQIRYDFNIKTNPLTAFDVISGTGTTTLFDTVKLGDILFDPSKADDRFVTGLGEIDVYEEEMKLYSSE